MACACNRALQAAAAAGVGGMRPHGLVGAYERVHIQGTPYSVQRLRKQLGCLVSGGTAFRSMSALALRRALAI